eukprot:1159138-Pelagomonas_calceolata.AAC.5
MPEMPSRHEAKDAILCQERLGKGAGLDGFGFLAVIDSRCGMQEGHRQSLILLSNSSISAVRLAAATNTAPRALVLQGLQLQMHVSHRQGLFLWLNSLMSAVRCTVFSFGPSIDFLHLHPHPLLAYREIRSALFCCSAQIQLQVGACSGGAGEDGGLQVRPREQLLEHAALQFHRTEHRTQRWRHFTTSSSCLDMQPCNLTGQTQNTAVKVHFTEGSSCLSTRPCNFTEQDTGLSNITAGSGAHGHRIQENVWHAPAGP